LPDVRDAHQELTLARKRRDPLLDLVGGSGDCLVEEVDVARIWEMISECSVSNRASSASCSARIFSRSHRGEIGGHHRVAGARDERVEHVAHKLAHALVASFIPAS
jgi:hypothetical protein